MHHPTRHRLRLSAGPDLSFITAGNVSTPAILLLHGFPTSAQMFRDVVPALSQVAYVIAPNLSGFGESDVLPEARPSHLRAATINIHPPIHPLALSSQQLEPDSRRWGHANRNSRCDMHVTDIHARCEWRRNLATLRPHATSATHRRRAAPLRAE